MGPLIHDDEFRTFELRPFQTSLTFENLRRSREGVLHVTDDVLLIARAALNSLPPDIVFQRGEIVNVEVVGNSCRWYEFQVCHISMDSARATIQCNTINRVYNREFFGFNRAKYAVVEASILATRIDFLPLSEIQSQMFTLAKLVEKTGGPREREAFDFLNEFVDNCSAKASVDSSIST